MNEPLDRVDEKGPEVEDTDIVLNAEDDATDDDAGDDADDETQCHVCESTLDTAGKCTNSDCPECDDYSSDDDEEEPDED